MTTEVDAYFAYEEKPSAPGSRRDDEEPPSAAGKRGDKESLGAGTRRDGLPVEIPILTEDDVCLPGRSAAEAYTVAEWFEFTFPLERFSARLRERVYSALLEAMRRNLGYHGLQPPETTIGELAAAWNLAMRALGYEVPEFRCLILSKRRPKKEN